MESTGQKRGTGEEVAAWTFVRGLLCMKIWQVLGIRGYSKVILERLIKGSNMPSEHDLHLSITEHRSTQDRAEIDWEANQDIHVRVKLPVSVGAGYELFRSQCLNHWSTSIAIDRSMQCRLPPCAPNTSHLQGKIGTI